MYLLVHIIIDIGTCTRPSSFLVQPHRCMVPLFPGQLSLWDISTENFFTLLLDVLAKGLLQIHMQMTYPRMYVSVRACVSLFIGWAYVLSALLSHNHGINGRYYNKLGDGLSNDENNDIAVCLIRLHCVLSDLAGTLTTQSDALGVPHEQISFHYHFFDQLGI